MSERYQDFLGDARPLHVYLAVNQAQARRMCFRASTKCVKTNPLVPCLRSRALGDGVPRSHSELTRRSTFSEFPWNHGILQAGVTASF